MTIFSNIGLNTKTFILFMLSNFLLIYLHMQVLTFSSSMKSTSNTKQTSSLLINLDKLSRWMMQTSWWLTWRGLQTKENIPTTVTSDMWPEEGTFQKTHTGMLSIENIPLMWTDDKSSFSTLTSKTWPLLREFFLIVRKVCIFRTTRFEKLLLWTKERTILNSFQKDST